MSEKKADVTYDFKYEHMGQSFMRENYKKEVLCLIDFSMGKLVCIEMSFRMHENCNYKFKKPYHKRTYYWEDVKDLGRAYVYFFIQKIDEYSYNLWIGNGEHVFNDSRCVLKNLSFDDAQVNCNRALGFYLITGIADAIEFLRGCVVQDFVYSDNMAAWRWACCRLGEHKVWFTADQYRLGGGIDDQAMYKKGIWSTFHHMFSKTLDEWEATGHRWPLGCPDAPRANQLMEMERIYKEMTSPKKFKQKKGLLL